MKEVTRDRYVDYCRNNWHLDESIDDNDVCPIVTHTDHTTGQIKAQAAYPKIGGIVSPTYLIDE